MLTTDQVAEFQQKGFLLGPRILDSNALDVFRAELERVITSSDGPQPLLKQNLGTVDAPVWQIVNIWFASDPFRELLSHPRSSKTSSSSLQRVTSECGTTRSSTNRRVLVA
jgi:hypothetical protein